jgi:site-specific DNA-methyltransferase (adenine-specific)
MAINLYNIDCMEFMKGLPDKAYDLAIVDPPFGSSIMAKNKFQRHKTTDTGYRNKTIPSPEYYKELYRISKRSIIWGCQYQMPFLLPGGSFIVWDKKADPDLHNMSSCDIAWYSKRERIRTFDGHWSGAVKFEREPTIHIHQKPVGLYKWVLKKYAKKGEKIFDSHGGSMSIAIACYDLGFDLDLCELDPDYFKSGKERYEAHVAKYAPASEIPVTKNGELKLF